MAFRARCRHIRGVSSWWAPIDVSGWAEHALEPRGKRPKIWLRDPQGGIWLRKAPPPERPHTLGSEPAIEVLALELARRAGVDVADTRPATWGNGGRGVVSRRFHEDDEQHHPGSELLGLPSESGSSPEARRRRDEGRASATLAAVREILLALDVAAGTSLLAPLARILAVDAWLGNGDRHSGNWALITGPRGWRLAPMYDPTACLGVELTDDRPQLQAPTDELVARYAARCGSGFGGGLDGRTGVPMTEVLAELAGWAEWPATLSDLGPRFHTITAGIDAILDAIPNDWLSDERKRFAGRLLAHRVRIL